MSKNFNLGIRLQNLRKSRGLSQEQLALRADITPTYLGQIERNTKNPTVRIIEKLCEAMDISLIDFFSSKEKLIENDLITTQILFQIADCSDEERKLILRIIRDIIRLRNL